MNKVSTNPFHLTTVNEKKEWLKNKGLVFDEKEEHLLSEMLLNYPFERFLNQIEGYYTGNKDVPFLQGVKVETIQEETFYCEKLIHIIFPFLMKTLYSFKTQLFYEIARETSPLPLPNWHLIEPNYHHTNNLVDITKTSNRILEEDQKKGKNQWFHNKYIGDYPVWLFIERVVEEDILTVLMGLKRKLFKKSIERLDCVDSKGVINIYQSLSRIRNVICHGNFLDLQRFNTGEDNIVNDSTINTWIKNKHKKNHINGLLILIMYVATKYCSKEVCENFTKELEVFLERVGERIEILFDLIPGDGASNRSTIEMLREILSKKREGY